MGSPLAKLIFLTYTPPKEKRQRTLNQLMTVHRTTLLHEARHLTRHCRTLKPSLHVFLQHFSTNDSRKERRTLSVSVPRHFNPRRTSRCVIQSNRSHWLLQCAGPLIKERKVTGLQQQSTSRSPSSPPGSAAFKQPP